MKLNMKMLKNIGKILIIGFLIIYCVYILYFFNSKLFSVEGLANKKDCSNCEMKPSSGNCITVKDVSFVETSDGIMDLSFIDTSYIFCPWESKCTNVGSDYLDNMSEKENRAVLSSRQIAQGKGQYDIICCSNSDFFDNDLINFNFSDINKVTAGLELCNKYTNLASGLEWVNVGTNRPLYGNEITDSNLYDMLSTSLTLTSTQWANTNIDYLHLDDYIKIGKNYYMPKKSLSNSSAYDINECNMIRDNSGMQGMLFERNITGTVDVLTDPLTTPKDLLDYTFQHSHKFKNKNDPESIRATKIFDNYIRILDKMNYTDAGKLIINVNELSTEQLNQKNNIQADLSNNYYEIGEDGKRIIELIDETYSYQLLNSDLSKHGLGTEYLLNEQQFFDCGGDVSSVYTKPFSEPQLNQIRADISAGINYFGVKDDAEYTTAKDFTKSSYPSEESLVLGLTHLPETGESGTAPVSVIGQYLTAINGFYEKQMDKMMGPRYHGVNQVLEFDNDRLDTKSSTFFTYDTCYNNTYGCQYEVTGDADFSWCGPDPYYQTMKF